MFWNLENTYFKICQNLFKKWQSKDLETPVPCLYRNFQRKLNWPVPPCFLANHLTPLGFLDQKNLNSSRCFMSSGCLFDGLEIVSRLLFIYFTRKIMTGHFKKKTFFPFLEWVGPPNTMVIFSDGKLEFNHPNFFEK